MIKTFHASLRFIVLLLLLIDWLAVYAYYDSASGLYYNITSESNKTVSVSYGRGGNVYIPSTITIPNKELVGHWYGPSGDHGSDEGWLEWLWSDYGSTYTVTEIGNWAFNYINDLYSVSIPPTVRYIGSYAFYGCIGLRHVTIPESVTQIGFNAFYGCDSLKTVTSQSYVPPYMSNEWCFSEKAYNNSALYVPYPSMNLYGKADWWKNFWMFEELGTEFHEGFYDSFGTTKPIGVTADGASKMFVFFDRTDIKDIKSWSIKTLIDEQEVNDTTIIGKFGELKKLENDKFGFDYCAPNDFPEQYGNKNSYEVRLEVRAVDEEGDSIKGKADITVMRTGVLLIHGLWGNQDCFSGLAGYLQNEAGYMPYQIMNCDYKATHSASFVDNTFTFAIINGCMEDLFRQLAKAGIISSKYDLVGHSMGGILSRMYAQEKNPKAVNRIITLDTPHSGSQLANYRSLAINWLESKRNESNSDWIRSKLNVLINRFDGETGDQAALENLMPSSAAMARLNDPVRMESAKGIPVHAISSYMTRNQLDYDDIQIGFEAVENKFFPIALVSVKDGTKEAPIGGSYNSQYDLLWNLFGGENDFAVSHISQTGGLSGNHLTTQTDVFLGHWGILSKAHHLNTNKWKVSYENITILLKAPKFSSAFSTDGFHPVDLSSESMGKKEPEHIVIKDAPETSFIHLNIERVDSLRSLDVRVTPSDDIESYITYAFIGDDKIIFSNDQPESRFVIPDYYEGQLTVYALGRTSNDELVVNSDSTRYVRAYPFSSLFFENQADRIMSIGQSLTFNVMVNWWNGYDYVTPLLSADKSGIIEINDQIVTAVNRGECKLIATYCGLTDSISIIVMPENDIVPGDVNGDGEINIGDINMIILNILDTDQDLRYDINGDGEVNIADVTMLIDIILSSV